MSSTIGEVNINLRLSLAQFKQDTKAGTEAAGTAAKQIASDMGTSMGEARGSVMLLNEELGVHMPRHLVTLIAKIPGLSAAFATMLPIVGIVAATKVIYELVEAHEKAKEAMQMAMAEMGAQGATVLDGLNEKLNQGKLKFLELADDGAGAAALKLDMLSHSTLVSLVSAFDSLGTSINKVLNDMGATGTFARVMGLKDASDSIKNLQSDVLKIRAGDASDEEKAKEIGQKIEWYKDKAKADLQTMQTTFNSPMGFGALTGGGHASDEQITAQKATYAALDDMSKAYHITKQTQDVDSTNIEIEEANKAAEESDKIWLAQNKEYERNLKAEEVMQTEAYKQAVSGIQESEKQKIDATRQGTQARLDAVIAAIKDEEAHGLQDTAYYKQLQEEKITIAVDINTRRMELERKLAVEMNSAEKGMIALSMAAKKEQADYDFKMNITTVEQHIQAQRDEAAQTLELEKQKNADVLAEMDANDPYYPVAVQKRLDADIQAQQKYNDDIVKLDHDSIENRKQAWDAGFNAMNSGMSTLVSDFTKGNGNILTDLKSMLQNMLTSWLDYFLQIQMKALETSLFMKAMGLASSGGSMFSAAGGGAGFGGGGAPVTAVSSGPDSIPFMADGGEVDAGKPYFTGDAGIELFVPGQDGAVISNALLKSAKQDKGVVNNFTQHVHGVSDADSFKKSSSQIQADAAGMLNAAARRNR